MVEVWQDQMNGGKITLFVTKDDRTDRRSVSRLVGNGDLHVVKVPHSAADYASYRAALSDELSSVGLAYRIGTLRSKSEYGIKIVVDNPTALPDGFGQGVPDDAYVVMAGPSPELSGLPQDNHPNGDLQAGLMLWLDLPEGWGICTWGVSGHTSNWNYIVSAGHCMGPGHWQSSGWIGNDIEVWAGSQLQNALWDHLTPGDAFLHSRLSEPFDASRISSPNANENCYHGTLNDPGRDCPWQIENRALHNLWEEGTDRTCASLGRSNTYRCGDIIDENVTLATGADFDNFRTTRAVEVGFQHQAGDSGAGLKWNDTLDGILICCSNPGETTTLMITAYDVKRGLAGGFDFNCAVGFARKDADEWGACPAIDR